MAEIPYIGLRESDAEQVITLQGTVDAASLDELLAVAAVAAASEKPVLLDWSEAEHLHTGALQVLVALQSELSRQGRPFAFADCPPGVRECLTVTGLDNVLTGSAAAGAGPGGG